jgi:hypothetical protein
MKFSIGYNFDTKALDILDAYKNNIESFYFPIPGEYLGSGRSIKETGSYSAQIPRIIRKCGSLKINSQLLLNATCEGKDGASKAHFERVLNFIKRLKDKGLNSVVITNPVYIGMIKKRIKGLRIESSVNCYVRTVEHALYLKDLGVDVLTIDRDINRDIPLIRRIKEKTGLKLKLMLNEGCLGNCPYRISHYNLLAHGVTLPQKNMEGVFFDRFCIQIYTKDPSKVLRVPFVPPEEAGRYKQFIDYYKLSTRVFSIKRINYA